MTLAEALILIGEEREHQDAKWGKLPDSGHEPLAWLVLMRHYLKRAEKKLLASVEGTGWVTEIRKATALGVACLEQHG